MPDIRLIAMDMDGTLLNPEQKISPGNAEALQLARKAGIKLAICSGRAAGDIAMFALQNNMPDCALLGANGTHCWLNPDGTVFADHVFKRRTMEEMVSLVLREGVLAAFFAQNNVLSFNDPDHSKDRSWTSHLEGEHAPVVYHGAENLSRAIGSGANKLVLCTDDPQQLRRIHQSLLQMKGIEISSSWADNFEIMPKGCNKGTAVAELAAYLGIKREQVMTFGDYDNDLPMIEWAGMGVAMGNACGKVKKAADHITASNAEDGVGCAIRTIALGLAE